MSTLTVIGRVKAKPGKADQLRPIILSMVVPTLGEEGCLRFEMNESEDGQEWVASELWESEELWQRHMKSPQLTKLQEASKDLAEYFEVFKGRFIQPKVFANV